MTHDTPPKRIWTRDISQRPCWSDDAGANEDILASEADDALPCDICRTPVTVDAVVDDAIWARISPTHDEGGYLCARCVCERLSEIAGWPAVRLTNAHTTSAGDAMVAAALQGAVEAPFPNTWRDDAHAVHDGRGLKAQRTWSAGFNACRDAIEALIPQPASAALDKLIAEAEARGRIKGLTEAGETASPWSIEAAEDICAAKGETK